VAARVKSALGAARREKERSMATRRFGGNQQGWNERQLAEILSKKYA